MKDLEYSRFKEFFNSSCSTCIGCLVGHESSDRQQPLEVLLALFTFQMELVDFSDDYNAIPAQVRRETIFFIYLKKIFTIIITFNRALYKNFSICEMKISWIIIYEIGSSWLVQYIIINSIEMLILNRGSA